VPAADSRDETVVLRAPGVAVDADTLAVATAHAAAAKLDVLDLVPADLSAPQLLELVTPVGRGVSAGDTAAVSKEALQATVVTRQAWQRVAGHGTIPAGAGPEVVLGPVAHLRAMKALADLSGTACGTAIAPGLRAAPLSPADRRAVLDAATGYATFAVLAYRVWGFVALATALARRPHRLAATAVAVAYCAQPILATAGTPSRRGRQAAASSASRLASTPADLGRMLVATPTFVEGDVDATRRRYGELLAEGTSRFFEPRRADCPWCGGTRLRRELRTGDAYQHKPGRFQLDRCETCDHLFQNPRLSAQGLDFYYRDFYDGLGEALMAKVFDSSGPAYLARAELLASHVTDPPKHWLDVGAGHGHFSRAARKRFPDTCFDGLDLGAGVEAGVRAGWLDNAVRGLFVDEAPRLAGAYDVVSMHHYLEHTTDIRAELAAAAAVLRPGGHLVVEMPDPQFPLRRVLRGAWQGYLQPQHLHMPPIDNLAAAIEDAGFDVVSRQFVADPGAGLVSGVLATWSRLAPLPDLPWRPPTGLAGRLWPVALAAAMFPALMPAVVGDAALFLFRGGQVHGSAYRILARRR
jgi:SAM-dependent methyltransferase